MQYCDFVTDMALDGLERAGADSIRQLKKLSYGIESSFVNLKNSELASRIGKPQGEYVTYDTSHAVEMDGKGRSHLIKQMSDTLIQLVGNVGYGTVLAVGLGNGEILADSLGAETVEGIKATRGRYADSGRKLTTCTLTAGVGGVTGVKSVELISALCDKIKPNAVILVDTLATSSARRIGTSFQLSSAGIAPGSGLNRGKPVINRELLRVPTISVGVPLILSEGTVIRDFVVKYTKASGSQHDEFLLRSLLADERLAQLSVAPKEIGALVSYSAQIIASAINAAFS